MKKFKKLIPAVVMLLIATMLMGTTTYAWFSMNKTVTASGMMVKAQAEGSIIITSTASLPTDGTKTTDYNFADPSATALYASTHDGVKDGTWSFSSGLKYVTNAENINLETGIMKNSTASLTYANADGVTNKEFYKDYSVYIAGDGQAFDNQTITITLDAVSVTGINKAVSVDFYGELVSTNKNADVSSANYLGTLNVAKTKNGTDDKSIVSTAGAGVTYLTVTGVNIPKSGATSGNKAYAITMRVYFDGALIEVAGSQSYTLYTAATGTAAANTYYYSDDQGTGPITIAADATLPDGTYTIASTNTKTYARTTEVANIGDVKLTATFKVETPST